MAQCKLARVKRTGWQRTIAKRRHRTGGERTLRVCLAPVLARWLFVLRLVSLQQLSARALLQTRPMRKRLW